MLVRTVKIAFLTLVWLLLGACAGKKSPDHDWSKVGSSIEQKQADHKRCLTFANKAQAHKKQDRRYARGDLSKKFQSRSYDYDGSISGLGLRAKYVGYCMYQLGYHSELERNRLPVGLQKMVDSNLNILRLVDEEPMVAYVNEYQAEGLHKAFALSPNGEWSWVARAASPADARGRSLEACENVKRDSQTPACVVINLDGVWQRVDVGD